MSIFDRIAGREASNIRALGKPSGNPEARKAGMAAMTGGRGFRQAKKEPGVYRDGLTRGEHKRKRAAEFRGRFTGEQRPLKRMHSHARREAEKRIAEARAAGVEDE